MRGCSAAADVMLLIENRSDTGIYKERDPPLKVLLDQKSIHKKKCNKLDQMSKSLIFFQS